MSEESVQILCTGDVHLGRRPTRVPTGKENLSVRAVWNRLVEAAVDRAVDAVALTGDVVDRENKAFEAFGALERGAQRLSEHEIPVVAVAGNHDFDVFPGLVESLGSESFHFLGRGGRWDAVSLGDGGGPAVQFLGWSFPGRYVRSSPLEDLSPEELDLDPETPTVGLLHAEVGGEESPYAPVDRSALTRPPVDGWLLGHIHAPGRHREEGQFHLYPGSLQPLDPGEDGPRGAWIVEVSPTGEIQAEPIWLASLRYERASVDVSTRSSAEEVRSQVLDALREDLKRVVEVQPRLGHVAYRVSLEGRTQLQGAIDRQARQMKSDLRLSYEGPGGTEVTATVEEVKVNTRPDYDLERMAEGSGACGTLARLLLDIEEDGSIDEALARKVRRVVETVRTSSGYEPLRADSATEAPPSEENLRTMIRQEGMRLLDRLRDQQAPSGTEVED